MTGLHGAEVGPGVSVRSRERLLHRRARYLAALHVLLATVGILLGVLLVALVLWAPVAREAVQQSERNAEGIRLILERVEECRTEEAP